MMLIWWYYTRHTHTTHTHTHNQKIEFVGIGSKWLARYKLLNYCKNTTTTATYYIGLHVYIFIYYIYILVFTYSMFSYHSGCTRVSYMYPSSIRFEFDFVCKRTVFFTFSSSVINLKETQKGAALTLSSAVSPLQRKKLNLNWKTTHKPFLITISVA